VSAINPWRGLVNEIRHHVAFVAIEWALDVMPMPYRLVYAQAFAWAIQASIEHDWKVKDGK
jgi:hypothetical protein